VKIGDSLGKLGRISDRVTTGERYPKDSQRRRLGHVWGMDEGTARDNSGIERSVMI
jgi:hypothetical protein